MDCSNVVPQMTGDTNLYNLINFGRYTLIFSCLNSYISMFFLSLSTKIDKIDKHRTEQR